MTTHSFTDPVFRDIPCALTIGVFDGLHRGHDRIIETCVDRAREKGVESVVITFNINPKMAKGREEKLLPLASDDDFRQILSEKGVDRLAVIDFSDNMSKLSGEEFMALLCTSYRLEAMIVGSSFRCGNPADSAGPARLEKLLGKYTSSASLEIVPPVLENGTEVSSSLIRRCLLTGDTEYASVLLGRAYSLDLRSVGFERKTGNRLFYSIRAFRQLLPCAGAYEVKAAGIAESAPMSGPADCDAEAVIGKDGLVLDLHARIIPDRIYFPSGE